MTASLVLYSLGTRLLEPIVPHLLARRVRQGKENIDRIGERLGVSPLPRPDGPLIWMHGASVGESRLLLDLFNAIAEKRSGLRALITTQTLTSAQLVAARGGDVLHQMAPADAPGAVERFLDHWRPDAVVFAEGEIWPNMLRAVRRRKLPAALVNARMTARTLKGWRSRPAAARELFSAFQFIGAADQSTAQSLATTLKRSIDIVGNLKRAATIEPPSDHEVLSWRSQIGGRSVVLAASTHPGEDDIALDAFSEVRTRQLGALLIIAPRHPERGPAIAEASRERGFTTQLRSTDHAAPGIETDVLVADTMGEMLFWYSASDAIYLGGAHAPDIGGHNAVETALLGKRVFTGPLGFNFQELFAGLKDIGALEIGAPGGLSDYWLRELDGETARTTAFDSFFADARGPFEATRDHILGMLTGTSAHA